MLSKGRAPSSGNLVTEPADEISVAPEPPRFNLRKVDLNLLVGLQPLLRYRNVSRAADYLGLSQSAMSDELRRLRLTFRDELLVRSGRGYELTRLARALVEPVDEILRNIEAVIASGTTFEPKTASRHFTIALSDYTTLILLGPLVKRVKAEAPGVTIGTRPFYSDASTMLRNDSVDVLLAPDYERKGLSSVPLLDERWMCVVDEDHPLKGDRMSLEDFQRLPHLTVSRRSDQVFLPEISVSRRVEVVTENWSLAPFLLSGTNLVAVLQRRLAIRLQHAAQVRLFEPPISIPPLTLRLYWNPVLETDPGNRWLRRLILEVARSL